MRIRLSDLSPGVNYSLQLRSNNGLEVSEWSRVFNIVTSDDIVAPKTPQNPVGSVAGTAFNFSWDAVIESADNSPAHDLTYYEVKVESGGSPITKTYKITDNKFLFTLEMNREVFTTPQANIKMSVRAVDKVGNASSYSGVVSLTNPAPSNPTGLSANPLTDAIALTWTGVSDADLTGYRVYSGTTAGSQTTLVWQGQSTSVTLPTTTYSSDRWYKVAAFDVFNTDSTNPPVVGPVRPNSPFGTDSTAPAVPTGLAATLSTLADGSMAAANVSWTAVTDTDGDMAGYQLGYRPVGASDWQYTTVDYTVTSTRIDRLTPYTNYEFKVRAYDFSANYSGWSTTVTTNSAATNTAPSTPSAPTVTSDTLRVQVIQPSTKAAGGAMEADVAYYEIYASTTTNFTAASSNMLGTIAVGPAQVGTFMVPATGGGNTQTWYVKSIAVDKLGLKSAASAQTTSTPGLVASANIIDASITNAKISNLNADKITGGSGFLNDISIKSKFTIGDAATTGAIESYDYGASGGSAGFRLSNSGLVVKTGQIEAAALKIQNSPNLVPAAFADFEYINDYYISSFWRSTGQNAMVQAGLIADALVRTNPAERFKGKQSLSLDSIGGTGLATAWFGSSSTDYNISVESGKTYIWSAYMRNRGVAQVWNINIKGNNGSIIATQGFSLAAAASETAMIRRSFAFTVPAGVNSIIINAEKPAGVAGAIWMDGQQLEEKTGATNDPSPWQPPGQTTVDGSGITTGQIKSSNTINIGGSTQPAWSLNTSGNIQVGDALIRGKLIVGTVDEAQPNRAPNNGDFESSVTGYSVFQSAATNSAIARTTDPAEVISGAGSAKVSADAGDKSRLGISFSPPSNLVAETTARVVARVKVDTTDANSTIRVVYWNSSAVDYEYEDVVIDPVAGTVYDIDVTHAIPEGQNVASISIGHAGDIITSTSFIIDDIALYLSTDVGSSYMQSANYIPGAAGWNINGQGDVEFNSGVFRGVLGAGVVTADSMASTINVSSLFRAGQENSRRVEFSEDGIAAYRPDNSLFALIPTDSEMAGSFDGDLLATSLTVSDQLAIRGSNNELSRTATLTLASGTTSPTSPPAVTVDYRTIPFTTGLDGFDAVRFGLAVQGGYFRTGMNVYGQGAVIESYRTNDGVRLYGSLNINANNGMWTIWGGIAAIGDNIYALGCRKDGSWRIMGWNVGTMVSGTPTRIMDIAYTQGSDDRGPALGVDYSNNNLLIGFSSKSNNTVKYKWVNMSTKVLSTSISSNLKYGSDFAYINKGVFDGRYGATPVFVVGARGGQTSWVLNSSFQRMSQYDFLSNGQALGQTFYNNRFYSAGLGNKVITEHTDLAWNQSTSGNSTWWVGNTWYNTDSTNGSKETNVGPMKSFTMKQRARVTISSPPLPIRPVPNTVDDATAVGIYMARSVSAPPRTNIERYAYLNDGVRARTIDVMPALPAVGTAATNPPPIASDFPNSSPAVIRSSNDRLILTGDGSGTWGKFAVDSAGITTLSGAVMDDTGWVSVGTLSSGFTAVSGQTPMVRRLNGGIYFRGAMTVPTGGWNTAFTVPVGFRPTSNMIMPASPNSTVNMSIQVNTNGTFQTYVSASTGAWFPLGGAHYLAS